MVASGGSRTNLPRVGGGYKRRWSDEMISKSIASLKLGIEIANHNQTEGLQPPNGFGLTILILNSNITNQLPRARRKGRNSFGSSHQRPPSSSSLEVRLFGPNHHRLLVCLLPNRPYLGFTQKLKKMKGKKRTRLRHSSRSHPSTKLSRFTCARPGFHPRLSAKSKNGTRPINPTT